MSYLVAIRGFVPQHVEFGFKFNFLLKIYANYMKRWLKYVIFGGHQMDFVPQRVEYGFKFSFLLKIYANYMKKLLKYVLFGGHQMCFRFPLHIELSPKLKLKSKID